MTDRENMKDWITKADSEHLLDICIANAGISGGTGDIESSAVFNQAQKILDVNVSGLMNTISPAGEKMRIRERGHIVIISSLASFSPWPGAPAYAATQAAVRILGEALIPNLKKKNISLSVVCFLETTTGNYTKKLLETKIY